jgi:isoleucyl-tRNA synthetase
MRGFRTPYVPGWDCHGLPIEHKVMKELQAKKQSLDALGVRKACAEFSAAYIEKQRGQFKRLGILADWASEYRTMDPAYEAEILGGFASFVEQGLVYRSKKPVYWSIPCQTALAEAEIEYKDKRSHSVWVAFPVADPAAKQLAPAHPLSVVIWTTTPWTLPANLAIAVHPDLEYVEVRHGDRSFLVASALREAFVAACALEGAVDGFKVKGRALEGLQPQHPFIDRPSPVVLADYVTTDAGTGCVHTAPGHGLEDYQTGNKYGMEPYCPVRDDGTYADDGKVPAALVGVTVLETDGKNPANIAVLELLKAKGALLKAQSLVGEPCQVRAAGAADEAAEQGVACGCAGRQHRGREETTEHVALLSAGRQVPESVERVRDIGDGVAAGDYGHCRHGGVFPVTQHARDGFVEGQGGPMPVGGGHDQLPGARAFLDAIRAAPGDVPAFGVSADLGGDAAQA